MSDATSAAVPTHQQRDSKSSPQPVQNQPRAKEGMVVAGGNRNVNNMPVGPKGRPWSFKLLDYEGDTGTCLLSSFAPCNVYGAIRQRYNHLNTHSTPDPQRGNEGYSSSDACGFCVVMSCFCWCIPEMKLRKDVRERYNIEGSKAEDCCIALCCTACDFTQISRELELEERDLGRD